MRQLNKIVGREKEIDKLHALFAADRAEGVPTVRVLTGLGGVGKTSLARRYAQRHRAEHRGTICWIQAEAEAAIDAEFRKVLEVLSTRRVQDVENPVSVVHSLLERSARPWLLVFDNVPDPAKTEGLIPPIGNGHVLITSQSTSWPPGSALAVSELDLRSATTLLIESSGDRDRAAAKSLALELDKLPLALVQAASFANANKLKLSEYLELYREHRRELHGQGKLGNYPHTVATTWQMAMGQLSTTARVLLNLLSHFASNDIPVGALFEARSNIIDIPNSIRQYIEPLFASKLNFRRALGELLTFSLATPSVGNSVQTIDIHRLVQAVTRDDLAAGPDAATWPIAAQELADAAMPDSLTDGESLKTWQRLHTHAHALIENLPVGSAKALRARARIAYWTGESGDATGARDQLAGIIANQSQWSAENSEDLFTVRTNYANWTGKAGDAVAARDYFEELIPALTSTLGEEHADTLRGRADHAHWTGEAESPSKAKDLLEELLPVQQRVLGTDHPDTLKTYGNLANWTGKGGDAAAARDLSESVCALRNTALGPQHRETLLGQLSLATWIGEAGDPSDALRQFEHLLPLVESAFGADHPDTLIARTNLAEWTGMAGNPEMARDLLSEILPVRERVLGVEHPTTLLTRNRLSGWIGRAGEPQRARDMCRELLPIQERVLGASHRDTLATKNNLSFWSRTSDARASVQHETDLTPEPVPQPDVSWVHLDYEAGPVAGGPVVTPDCSPPCYQVAR